MKPYIETFSGKLFELESPNHTIDIEDIAHALSNLCRFAGHCKKFYSVAEHSVHCSYITPQKYAKAALLHDASEAYLCDIPTPFKPYLGNYYELEEALQAEVAEYFGLEVGFEKHPEVIAADRMALKLEAFYLTESKGKTFHPNIQASPYSQIFNPDITGYEDLGVSPEKAKAAFLDRYRALRLS